MTERIAGHEIHPAASALPLMEKKDLDALAEDIKKNGQEIPIVAYRGVIIDGRNRLLACELAGIEPEIQEWMGADDQRSVTAYIASMNVARRHLTADQKAAAGTKLLPHFEGEARGRQRVAAIETNAKKTGEALSAPGTLSDPKGKAAAQAAAAMGVGTRTMERAAAIAKKAPELLDQVRDGKTTLKQAEKQIRRAEQKVAVKAYQPPVGEWAVIVADPPWPYEDTLDGSDQARGGLPYPPMSMDEICAMKIPASRDCVLWLWVTNSHLIDGSATRVLREWGFEPKSLLTWKKDRMGAGHYLRNITEHVILAVRGKPMIEGEAQINFLEAKRREHSRKPDEFFDLVERVCPSLSRLEMFSREPRKGWTTSGAEGLLFEAERSSEDPKILKGSIDAGNLCGVYSGNGKKAVACNLRQDHEGPHTDGYFFWPNKVQKRKTAPPPELELDGPMALSEFCRNAKKAGFKTKPQPGKTAVEIVCKECGSSWTKPLTKHLDIDPKYQELFELHRHDRKPSKKRKP